jgi:hypothetical protein
MTPSALGGYLRTLAHAKFPGSRGSLTRSARSPNTLLTPPIHSSGMRLLMVSVVVLVVAGCGGSRMLPRTQLTMIALNANIGRAVFHLSCAPVGGDLPTAAKACAALSHNVALVENPKPFNCFGGLSSWWDVEISGRLNGKPLRRQFSTCWTPQMATIARLGLGGKALQQHMLPRRRAALLAGTTRSWPGGALRSADLVTCDILGHHLETGVPDTTGPDAKMSTGFGGTNVTSVVLTVAHNSDGSVTASCHKGSA